jgi:hypothetical protein
MTIAVRQSGSAKSVTGIGVRVSGALKTVTEAWVRSGGELRRIFTIAAVALSTYLAYGRANSAATANVVSEAVTATPSGTIGPVTYAWSRTDSDPHAWTIDDPGGQTTTFSTLAAQGETWTATFICTVTDQAGQVVASDPVSVNCANIYYGGGYVGNPSLPPGTVYP